MYQEQKTIDTWPNYRLLLHAIFNNDRRLLVKSMSGGRPKGYPAWNKKFDLCQIKGCGRKHRAKGVCISHYSKLRRKML